MRQMITIELGCCLYCYEVGFTKTVALLLFCCHFFFWELDVRKLCTPAQCLGKSKVKVLFHELDNVATSPAHKAVIGLFCRTDYH